MSGIPSSPAVAAPQPARLEPAFISVHLGEATRGGLDTKTCLQCGVLQAQPVSRRLLRGGLAQWLFLVVVGAVLLGLGARLLPRGVVALVDAGAVPYVAWPTYLVQQLEEPLRWTGAAVMLVRLAMYGLGAWVSLRAVRRVLGLPPLVLGLCRRCDGADRRWMRTSLWLGVMALGGWLVVAVHVDAACRGFKGGAAWLEATWFGTLALWLMTCAAFAKHVRRGRMARIQLVRQHGEFLKLGVTSSWEEVLKREHPSTFYRVESQVFLPGDGKEKLAVVLVLLVLSWIGWVMWPCAHLEKPAPTVHE